MPTDDAVRPHAWLLTIERFDGTTEVIVKRAKTQAVAVSEALQRSGRRSVLNAVALTREQYEANRPKPKVGQPRRWNLK